MYLFNLYKFMSPNYNNSNSDFFKIKNKVQKP